MVAVDDRRFYHTEHPPTDLSPSLSVAEHKVLARNRNGLCHML